MSDIIIGRYKDRYLVARGQQFVLLAAPTASNKGVAVVIPNLLNFADSVVVFDLKLELFRFTSKFRAEHGQSVYLFAPFAQDRYSHRWNVLDTVSRDPVRRVGDATAVGQVFYPSDCDPREKFWNDGARNLFLAFVLYLVETPTLRCTMGEVLRQSSGKGKPLKDHIQSLVRDRAGAAPLSDDCRDAFGRFLASPENTLGNIISTFNAPLLPFANPIVDAATSHSDFDISLLRKQRMSIYIGIPPSKLADASLLVNMLFSRIMDVNSNELPEENPELRYQCLLVLDEFSALGKVSILAKANSYIRGYGVRLLTVIQSIAQLESVYGPADTRTLVTNHAIQIIYPPREQKDANEYSEMLGYLTEQTVSKSVSRPRSFGQGGSTSENTSAQRRALMLPQELKELPAHQQIVLCANLKPIRCEKARYYEDDRFLDRLRSVSPSLAQLDASFGNKLLRAFGLGALGRPTELQLKHSAFVLRDLSIAVPLLEMEGPSAGESSDAQRRANDVPDGGIGTRPLEAGEAIDLAALAIDVDALPAFDDPINPSPESVANLVDQFFAQLEWTTPHDEQEIAQMDTEPVSANLIEAHQSSQTNSAVPSERMTKHGKLDLSILDDLPSPFQPRNQP